MRAPESFARDIIGRHPKAIEIITRHEDHRADFEASGEWPGWCALPISVVYTALAEELGVDHLKADTIRDLAPLTAAWIWSKAKQIFVFDRTLLAELLSQPFDGAIPGDALKRLPVPCVYIDNALDINGDRAEGLFAWIEYDGNNQWAELRLLILFAGGSTGSYSCPLRGTIGESLKALQEASLKSADAEMLPLVEKVNDHLEAVAGMISQLLNVLLYLCAEKPEYTTPPRKYSRSPSGFTAERTPRKPAVTVVGERIGATIRAGSKTCLQMPCGKGGRTHASPVPHIRRAHWHHYWTGAYDSADRRLILKWTPPVFVGSAEPATTIRPVKGGKNED